MSKSIYDDACAVLRSSGHPGVAQDAIEALVDVAGVAGVLRALVAVCEAKSQHLAEAWQDEESARRWSKAGVVVEKLAAKLPTLP